MYWQKRFDRPNPDQEIEEKMLEIRKDHKDYGCLRLKKELENQGIHVNKKKIQRLIKKLGIEVKSYTRKSRRYNSYRGKVGTVAKNRIHRRFYTNICHQKITTDTTEFKYYEVDTTGVVRQKKLYLDPFMDFYNSEILSYRISEKPNALAIMEGLEEAIQITNDCPFRRIFQSMSPKGNCLDNSPMENFFGLLKQEIFHGEIYRSFDELKTKIDQYIYYYKHKRIKKKLNRRSPVQFREAVKTAV